MTPGRVRTKRRGTRFGRRLSVVLLVLAAILSATSAGLVVSELRRSPVETGPGGTGASGESGSGGGSGGGGGGGGASGRAPSGAGALVPAYDLASDPVFPTLEDGYAIEEHGSGGLVSDHLAATDNGGRTWYLVGAPFPFENGPLGYTEVQFMSLEDGYAFGPAGFAVTHDGGRHWAEAVGLSGALQRVVPIGNDVWATETTCTGPPLEVTRCTVELAISTDAGLVWQRATGTVPLSEARAGGDVLARVSTTKAFVASYGATGGGLALTTDSGRTWTSLPDPCRQWQRVDLAAVSNGDLWMICGGPPVLAGTASAKAVFRSYDGGRHWTLAASTGFGPPFGPGGAHAPSGPVGSIAYAGQLSQLATIAPKSAWIGVSGVGVLVSFDYGRRWKLASGIEDDGHDSGVGVTFDDPHHGWAIEFHEGVWKTSDAVRWTLVDGT